MATFLIHNKNNNTYQEVLQVSCVVQTFNRQKQRNYKFERKMLPERLFECLNIKSSYKLNSLEDIQKVEDMYKKELLGLITEQRDRKVANHRSMVSNYILRVNDKEVFNLKQTFDKLWEVTDEQLQEVVDNIKFSILGNGAVYENTLGAIRESVNTTGYLI